MDSARVAGIEIFRGLPEAELEAVARNAFEHELDSGEMLVSEGDFGHALFAIDSGTADIIRGKETVATVGPGDVVGEMAVLSSGRRAASIRATSPMRLICLFKRDVWALERLAPLAAQRLREAIDERRRSWGDGPAARDEDDQTGQSLTPA
jgi:CRP-like cAMP-binding protein